MKQVTYSLVILVMLLLAGCGNTGSTSAISEVGNLPEPEVGVESGAVAPPGIPGTQQVLPGDQQPGMGNGDPFQLSAQAQLLIGLIGLEKTDFALNATQATSLLPALTSLQEEISKGTITQARIEEMDAYTRSILSLEQVNAITELDLSQENMKTILDPYGISLQQWGGGNGNGGEQGTPPAGAGGGGAPGAIPQGTPPADPGTGSGLGPGGGGNGNPQNASRAGNGYYPEGLLETLIGLLQTRSAE